MLDLFCYTGGFGLVCAGGRGGQVTFVDASESALAICREAVSRNGWLDRAEFLKTDIFPFLKIIPDRYDAVVLDPPALAKSRTKVPAALRAYRDLNARAMTAVKPDGVFATASCSGLVQPPVWRDTLREAAVQSRAAAADSPAGRTSTGSSSACSMPETEYLKFVIGVA